MCAIATFLLENGRDIHAAVNSWGATPLQLAIENGHRSTVGIILSRLIESPLELAVASIWTHAILDHRGNGILHRLCYKLSESRIEVVDFMSRLHSNYWDTILQWILINRSNHKGFTPLSIVLTTAELALSGPVAATISRLLSFGARFSNVTPLYQDNINHAWCFPWYHEAEEAYQLSPSRLPQTFDDVTRVYHLLRLLPLPRYSPPIARLVMDMQSIGCTSKSSKTTSATPPPMVAYQFHCRHLQTTLEDGRLAVLFFCNAGEVQDRTSKSVLHRSRATLHVDSPMEDVLRLLSIRVRLIRHNEIYAIPILLEPRYKTVFDVWDKHTPAKKKGRERKKLRVTDLKQGDAFDVKFVGFFDDFFAFEFCVGVYYSIGDRK